MEQKLWKCKKCKREFKKKNQTHSCVVYPIKNHFKNKELAKELFEYFKKEIQKNVGPLKIESLPCCIHLVSNYTFGAVWALKDKIRIDFRVDRKIESKKIWKMIQMSPGRFLYYFEIYNKKEIDKELLSYVKEAYNLNKK